MSTWRLSILILLTATVSQTCVANKVVVPKLSWRFYSTVNGRSYLAPPGLPLDKVVPSHVPCCKGKLRTQIDLTSNDVTPQADLAIWLPIAGGLTGVRVNSYEINIPPGDYTNVGPLIPLPLPVQQGGKADLALTIGIPRTFYSGFWLKDTLLTIGPLAELTQLRDNWIRRQIFAPAFYVFVFVLISLVLIWIQKTTSLSDRRLIAFTWTLLSWSLFFAFLAGIPRSHFPVLGSALHLPVRCAAALFLIRMIALTSEVSDHHLKRVTWVLGLLVVLSIPFGLAVRQDLQSIIYATVNAVFVYYAIRLGFRARTLLQKIVAVAAVIASIGFVSDSLKLVIEVNSVNLNYPFIYLNRYTTPPLLFTAVIYIGDQLSKALLNSWRFGAVVELANQVAHDLRSPLGALKVLAADSDNMPGDTRDLLKITASRISEIVGSLDATPLKGAHIHCIRELSSLVISEKQLEYSRFKNLEIVFNVHDMRPLQAVVDPTEYKRALSNLINNAAEALNHNGRIQISIDGRHDDIEVVVQDNGPGISPEISQHLGHKGATFAKPHGSGLGLFHAKRTAECFGGSLLISSRRNEGTSVVLRIPGVSAARRPQSS